MLFYTEKSTIVAIAFLITLGVCSANIQEVRTQFVTNKLLSTSYDTRQPISGINCVQWCFEERQTGKCKTAGYNRYAKSCSLSMDNPNDLLDVVDAMTGVFFIGDYLFNCIN